jgi:hypothetical protein
MKVKEIRTELFDRMKLAIESNGVLYLQSDTPKLLKTKFDVM